MTQHSTLRITLPNTRINDALQLSNEHWQVLNSHSMNFTNKSHKDSGIENLNRLNQSYLFDTKMLSQSLVYVITETVGNYPYPYLSEKTWKAMLAPTPFMIVGARHSLKKLHEFGFLTFDSWWSEEYDNCLHIADRIKLVTIELKKLSVLPHQELIQLKHQMYQTLCHNQQHIAQFRAADIENIQTELQSHQ